jgi:RecA/RadA recombinase
MAALPNANEEATVYYFDTEGTFSPSRIEQIAWQYCIDEESVNSVLDRVIQVTSKYLLLTSKFHASSSSNLHNFLVQIGSFDLGFHSPSAEEKIIEENVKLIVIDSLAAVIRRDFDSEALSERQVSARNCFSYLYSLSYPRFHLY